MSNKTMIARRLIRKSRAGTPKRDIWDDSEYPDTPLPGAKAPRTWSQWFSKLIIGAIPVICTILWIAMKLVVIMFAFIVAFIGALVWHKRS